MEKRERFSIRKLTVGAASVLIGATFLGYNANQAKADTVDDNSTQTTEVSKNNVLETQNKTEDTEVKVSSPAETSKQTLEQKQVTNTQTTSDKKEAAQIQTTLDQNKMVDNSAQVQASRNEVDNREHVTKNDIPVQNTEQKTLQNKLEDKIQTNTLNVKSLSQKVVASKNALLAQKNATNPVKESNVELLSKGNTEADLSPMPTENTGNMRTAWGIGLKADFTVDGTAISKGDTPIKLVTITENNSLNSNWHLNTNQQQFDAILDGKKIGTYSVKAVDIHNAELYLTPDKDNDFIGDVKLSVSTPYLFNYNFRTPAINYRGLTKDKPATSTISTGSHSYHFTITAPDIYEVDYTKGKASTWQNGYSAAATTGYLPFVQDDSDKTEIVHELESSNGKSMSATLQNYKQVLQITGSNIIGLENYDKYNFQLNDNSINVIDANGKMTNDYIGVSANGGKNIAIQSLTDNLTPEQLYEQTPNNTLGYSKQGDGSYLISYNFSPEAYQLTDNLEKEIRANSVLVNIVDPQNADKIVNNTMSFYQGALKNTPLEIVNAVFLRSNGSTDFTIKNVTPGDSRHEQDTGFIGEALGTADGAFAKYVNVQMVDDDAEQKIVGTPQLLRGKTGDNVEIKYEVPNGYVLVPNQAIPTTYQLQNKNNPIIIHLTHDKKQVTQDNGQLIRVVTVVSPDGSTKEVSNKIYKISRTGMQDLVTGKTTWNNWTTANVDAVEVPYINGYTAYLDEGNKSLATSNGKGALTIVKESFTGNNDKPDEVPNVVEKFKVSYRANTQTARVIITDTTAKKQLDARDLAGKSGTTDPYDPTELINAYLTKGYQLDKNDIAAAGGKVIFDKNDDKDQTYYIDLSHVFTPLHEEHVIKETVHFTTSDGKTKLADDYVKTLTFKRDGKHDKVENKDLWNAWQPGDTQNFPALKGVYVEGYTPDNEVEEITVKPDSKDIERTITYTPDMQFAHVVYIDDDNKGEILANDDLNGRTNEKSKYTTADRVEEFTNKGYQFVKSTVPKDGIIFDTKDKIDQTYEVHFKHRIEDVTDPRILTATFDRVIIEKLPNGKDKQIKQHYEIKRTAKQDMVTKAYTFGDWSTADIKEDKADVLTGYTAKINSAKPEDFISLVNGVPTAKAEKFTNENGKLLPKNITETAEIIYSANSQKASITYIDDTTGKTLEKVDVDGHFAEEIKFTPSVEDKIKSYTDKGYVLKSNDFKNQKYDADDTKNNFTVHLTHGYTTVTRSKNVTETIHYNYSDGTKAKEDYVASKEFVDGGIQDLVTGETTWNNDWIPAADKFAQVDSPVIDGYTADKSNIPEQDVNSSSSNLEFTVTYTKDPEKNDNSVANTEKPTKSTETDKKEDKQSDDDLVVSEPEVKSVPDSEIKTTAATSSTKHVPKQVTNVSVPSATTNSEVVKSPKKANTLPQTGDKQEDVLVAAGVALSGVVGMLGLSAKKRKED